MLALEDRLRRRDLLATEDVRADFFDRRIGADVVSARHFDSWWKQERRDRADLLTYTLDQAGRMTRRATIWQRFEARWRILYHQGAIVSGSNE